MKLVLAGAENPTSFESAAKMRASNVLVSYWYLRKQNPDRVKALFERMRELEMWVMMDSGAHSFFAEYIDKPKEEIRRKLDLSATERAECNYTFEELENERLLAIEHARPNIEQYVRGLIDFTSEYSEYLDAYAELDVDELVGYDTVTKWRELWMAAGLGPIVTIHGSQTREQQQDTLAFSVKCGSHYIGVGKGMQNDASGSLTQWLADYRSTLEKDKIKVHGWAMSKINNILRMPFYSVDSTTWISGQVYGMTYVYEPGSLRMKSYDNTQKDVIRSQLVGTVAKLGLDTEKFLLDDPHVVADYNAAQWIAMSKELENYNINAYWLDADDRLALIQKETEKWRTSISTVRRANETQLANSSLQTAVDTMRYCNTCFLGPKCPQFSPDATCTLSSVSALRDMRDIKSAMADLLAIQLDRIAFGVQAERIQGQPLQEVVSKEFERTVKMARQIQDIIEPKKVVPLGSQIAAGMVAGQAAAQELQRGSGSIDITPKPAFSLASLFSSNSGGTIGTRAESSAQQTVAKVSNRQVETAYSAEFDEPQNKDSGEVTIVDSQE